MAERFVPLAAGRLLSWILAEEPRGQIFGIHRDLFFKSAAADPFHLAFCGRRLETPLGVAAGPHTQLAQNIISAWLCGARFIELKTVQTLDRLELPKPCIAMAAGAGYNCEWSQELTLDESFSQYLAAWVLLHILKHRFCGPFGSDPGFIFNISVGYDLNGISQPNMQRFFERVSFCRDEKEAMLRELAPLFPEIGEIDIPDRMADGVTLSTMHGCPPEEIEKIGLYLLNEKKLHTTVKLNPTLLGAERLRDLLNGRLGWPVQVPDRAFAHDLQYDAALDLLRSLQGCAAKNGLHFGVKLTNTLECLNEGGPLPGQAQEVYLSGRPLHPLAVALARRLQDDFQGGLAISFSAGADCFNAAEILACGLKPLTVCSDLLRPGGYARLGQYLEEIRSFMASCSAASLEELALKRAQCHDPAQAVMKNLLAYEVALAEDESYRAPMLPAPAFKNERLLSWFDCAAAPCREACAIGQDVPGYMHWVENGDADRAAQVIWQTNPLPALCAMACDQQCRGRCTRGLFDRPLAIRAVKRFALENGNVQIGGAVSAAYAARIAIIGAGPSGLSAARDLAQAGFRVEVFEAGAVAGGLAATVIPGFRLGGAALAQDVARLETLGVVFHFRQAIDPRQLKGLLETFDLVYLAGGAGRGRKLLVPGEDAAGVFDALEFLAAVKNGEKPALGSRILVIGGGNSAIDAARSSLRLAGESARVTLVYRRTLAAMPAAGEEIRLALAEGVRILELTAPVRIEAAEGRVKSLFCTRLELGERDESGRPRPLPVFGSEFGLACDSLIVAIGQEKVPARLAGLKWGPVDEHGLTAHPRLFVGGDIRRGASTLIQAMADGSRAAAGMGKLAGRPFAASAGKSVHKLTWSEHQLRRARRERVQAFPEPLAGRDLFTSPAGLDAQSARPEAGRCLHCDDYCQLCAGVCPNRAMVGFETTPGRYPVLHAAAVQGKIRLRVADPLRVRQNFQVLHIVDFCNGCGNCATFCPTAGAPYRDKPHLYLDKKSFSRAADGFFLEPSRADGTRVLQARSNGILHRLHGGAFWLEFRNRLYRLKLRRDDFSILSAEWQPGGEDVFDGLLLARMVVLLDALRPFWRGDKNDV